MKFGLEKRRPKEAEGSSGAMVQLRNGGRHPFGVLDGYVPLQQGEMRLYRTMREAVPLIDGAILKLIRLVSGVRAQCDDPRAQAGMDDFFRRVPTGRGQRGIQSFLDSYLDSMLTCGRGVGEIVMDGRGRDVAAVLCGHVGHIEVREGETPLDFVVCARGEGGLAQPVPYPELILFTPFQPEADHPYGVSLLRSMPFMVEILLKIYQAMGMNWERMGNVRFAVVSKLGEGQEGRAQDRCQEIAREWSAAMQASRDGSVRDFVSVGDVDIRVIGADNQILDSEIPVRQVLEQIVSRTGLPPFLLGLSWSTTEHMSEQQADMLTSELTAIRRSLEPMLCKICELWLRVKGYSGGVEIVWDDINLQDEVEEAKAALYRAQTAALEKG